MTFINAFSTLFPVNAEVSR